MDQFTKTSLLLVSTMIFWIWQTAHPTLDASLPFISIGHESLSLPVSQIICQYVGIGTVLSAYSLYAAVSNGTLSFAKNMLFLVLVYVLACGHGIHVACVILQRNMSEENPVYPLVFFLHEVWSHNHFQFAIFTTFFSIIWAEKSCAFQNFRKAQPSTPKSQNAVPKQSDVWKFFASLMPSIWPAVVWFNSVMWYLFVGWMRWIWPVVMGLYFSIFGSRTDTKPITFLFYVVVLLVLLVVYGQFSVSLSAFRKLLHTKMIVLGSLAKAAVIGLPLLMIEF